MSAFLQIAIIAVALWIGSWLIMIVMAKRLPPGLLRDAAEFLPACVTTARRLRGNPAVPRRAKIAQEMYDELGPDGHRAHTVQQIADEFGVTRPTIYRHLQRQTD